MTDSSVVKALQVKQNNAWDVMRVSERGSSFFADALALYEETVDGLIEQLGTDAPVHEIDIELSSIYSDMYKDENNIRPRMITSYEEVKSYIARKSLEQRYPHQPGLMVHPQPPSLTAFELAFKRAS